MRCLIWSTHPRYRLHHVIAPCLRLVISVTAALPDSAAVRAEARLFVEGHYRALDRVRGGSQGP